MKIKIPLFNVQNSASYTSLQKARSGGFGIWSPFLCACLLGAVVGLGPFLCYSELNRDKWTLVRDEANEDYVCDYTNDAAFAYDLSGTMCICNKEYSPSRAWKMFADNHGGYIIPHLLAVFHKYFFLRDIWITISFVYFNESLEELLLMATGTWGFHFGDASGAESRMDSLVRDTFFSLLFGLPVIIYVFKLGNLDAKLPKLFKFPVAWSADVSNPSSALRFLLVVNEYFVITTINLGYKSPRKLNDYERWGNLLLAFLVPCTSLSIYAINKLAKVYEKRLLGDWWTVHYRWALLQFFTILLAYWAPLAEVYEVIILSGVFLLGFVIMQLVGM